MPVKLLSGCWLDGVNHKDASLRPLTGHDEDYLLSVSGYVTPPGWTTALLTSCLTNLGPTRPVTEDFVRGLTVGDREALLLHLRRLLIGERLSCTVRCSNEHCGAMLDVDVAVSDLLVPPYPDTSIWHDVTLEIDDDGYDVRFRLPTGADQETIADLAAHDAAAAAEDLLHRCVDSVTLAGEPAEIWPESLGGRISDLIDKLDPQAQLILNLNCSECGQPVSTLLDMGQFLAQEWNHRIEHLHREVHLLAWYYHWSESEIMSMTFRKRQLYLELLDETVSEARNR